MIPGVPARAVGLGLRRPLLEQFTDDALAAIDFFELAPENWIGVGGRHGRRLRNITEQKPLICHGLSLDIGGPRPLDTALLDDLRDFLDQHNACAYSEHLSACADDGHLHELLPLPFTEATLRYLAPRIHQVQEHLNRPLILENVSAYAQWPGEMQEHEFLASIVKTTSCRLLLDINNVYVNSVNQGLDARHYISSLPSDAIAYFHIAGHKRRNDGLLIDTHGQTVAAAVNALLAFTVAHHGPRPLLLERDFNLPPLTELIGEIEHLRTIVEHAHGP